MPEPTRHENYDPDPNLKIWMNGKFLSTADAKINVFDHCILYGDGVFEGIRSYSGRIFERAAHVKRFFNSAKAIRLSLPYNFEQVEAALEETLVANGMNVPEKDGYIRMVATRGIGKLGISPIRTWKPTIYIIVSTIAMYPPEMYETGMAIITSSYTRNSPNALPPQIKSCNYLNNILAKIEAHDAGVMEAVMLNHEGYVAECTGDNIFIVKGDQLLTPPVSAGILEGITRATVIRLARDLGIEVQEKSIVRMDLYTAEECFLTGTGAEIIGVTTIDGREIGNGRVGPMTKTLAAEYKKLVRSHAEGRSTGATRSYAGVAGE